MESSGPSISIGSRRERGSRWFKCDNFFQGGAAHNSQNRSQCRNSAARGMVRLVEVMFLRAAARKWITKAAKVPTKLPKMADSTLWVVYKNANPAVLISWREPRANASFVANSDRSRLGTTIPAMNTVNASSTSSRASEKKFCLFMVFAFSFRTALSNNAVRDRIDLAE